jgi:hypothetical protein
MTEKNMVAVAEPLAPRVASAGDATKAKPRPERFWLEALIVRASRAFGSLQFAVILLSLFAAVLAIGTVIESDYNSTIAQDVVYRAWWFKLLLFLLGVNIFFAAAKKWPWKKYQTGFLITHIGLLTLVTGGMVTSFSNTDGRMDLIDTSDESIQYDNGFAQTGSEAVLADEAAIRVRNLTPGKGHAQSRSFRFESGPVAWHSDQYLTPKSRPLLDTLSWLAHPLPRTWSADIGDDLTLDVLSYYPHAVEEPYSQAKDDERGFPAIKLQLYSPAMGKIPKEPWLALMPEANSFEFPPVLIELVGRCPKSLLGEFLQPPAQSKLGTRGVLAVALGDKVQHVSVDTALEREVQIGDKSLKVLEYYPDYMNRDKKLPDEQPKFPTVRLRVKDKAGKTIEYLTLARFAGLAIPIGSDGKPTGPDPNHLEVWYHPPDYRYGQDVRGLLQFAVDDREMLYYRSFHSGTSGFGFERSGTVENDTAYPIWTGMKWEFRLVEYLAHAAHDIRFVPTDARPGLQKPGLSPVLRCRIHSAKERSDQFWVALNDKPTAVKIGGCTYDVSYNFLKRPLDFEIKLLRAEQTVDGGTQQPASFTSYVQLSDDGSFTVPWIPVSLRSLTNFMGLSSGGEKIESQDRVITMNAPLEHRGYKVYQANYQSMQQWDSRGKPVSYSGFAIGRDPGLPFKYAGSTMLALGIACMFYMKAYFFKPRGRSVQSPAVPAASGSGQGDGKFPTPVKE